MATEIEYVKERFFRPDRENLKSLALKDGFLRYSIYALNGLCVVSSALMAAGIGGDSTNFLAQSSFWGSLLAYFIMLTDRDKNVKAKNESVTENKPEKNYLVNLGFQLEKFYGNANKSLRAPNNISRPLLFDAEQFKRHILIMATIGAGKSVFMKGIMEQLLLNDAAFFCVDGKGTLEFAKEVYGLFAALGREDDFIHINFLDMDNTHTINPLLSGSAEALFEILTSLLEGEENEWKAKQKEYMRNILKLLVYRRDKENLPLDFSVLARYLTLSDLVNAGIEYREKVYASTAIDDFVTYVATAISMPFQEFLDASPDTIKRRLQEAQSNGEQGAYDASMSAQAWIGVITSLKSDYGRVFNTQTPTISLYEAVQKNKCIFVTLPTMASDTTPKQLGKLLLGLIKGVAAEKAEKAEEPKIPFVCLFDEIGSYMVEGFGRLMSKSRALGISIVPIFQSQSQIDSTGKVVGSASVERSEIFDTTGTHILMKNINPAVTEEYAKLIKEQRYIDKEFADRRDGIKGQLGVEDRYKVEKEAAIKHDEVMAMNNGEMMVFNDGKMYRAAAATEESLALYGKKIFFELKLMDSPIPLTQYISKRDFFKETYRIYKQMQEIGG